jgi:hypothetical protein
LDTITQSRFFIPSLHINLFVAGLELIKMPPAYTTQQKAAISEFVAFTRTDRTQAARVSIALSDSGNSLPFKPHGLNFVY